MASSSSRRRRANGDDGQALEEGEYVPGYYSSASDDMDNDNRNNSLRSRREEETRPPQLSRRMEDILVAMGQNDGMPSPTPSSECESDGTISDDDVGHSAAPSADGVEAPMGWVYPCHVPEKGFGSPNPSHPLQPMPLAARSNLPSSSMASPKTNLDSGETRSPHLINNDSVATDVAAAGANISNEVFVHQQPAPPPQEAQQAHQVVIQLSPAVPPPPAAVQGPAAPPREFPCKTCGKVYRTYQGLGGHAAGHANRRKEAEAAAARVAQDGGVIPAAARHGPRKEHRCDKCDKVFPTGVALGGHKRMHYNGPPIVQHRKNKKRCIAPPPPVVAPLAQAPPAADCMADGDLTLALGIREGQPSVLPAETGGRLRLFGVDIGPLAEAAPVVQEGTDVIKPQAEAPVAQEGTTDFKPHEEAAQEGSSSPMTEGSVSTARDQRQDEGVEKSNTESPSKESSN